PVRPAEGIADLGAVEADLDRGDIRAVAVRGTDTDGRRARRQDVAVARARDRNRDRRAARATSVPTVPTVPAAAGVRVVTGDQVVLLPHGIADQHRDLRVLRRHLGCADLELSGYAGGGRPGAGRDRPRGRVVQPHLLRDLVPVARRDVDAHTYAVPGRRREGQTGGLRPAAVQLPALQVDTGRTLQRARRAEPRRLLAGEDK